MVLTLVLLPAVAGMMEQGDVGFATLCSRYGDHHRQGDRIYRHYDAGRSPSGAVDYGTQRSNRFRELFTLSVLALALGIAFGAVELFDVSFALGAFFAGMVLNELN